MSAYPARICADCGERLGHMPDDHRATFHEDTCGWCGREGVSCCRPRDYGYPPAPELSR